jgi:glycosyltransferase involved in cell wall biosynthesis
VSLGVDLERFHPRRAAARAATRERLGLGEEPLFLYTGRYAREKELDVLLAAWPAVERASGAVLALAGAGPQERRLRALAGPRVRWIPFERDRDRLAELYAAADAYVAPCPVESFGIAALEAQACGVPVLCADRGGVAERVERCGGGISFRSGDPARLAAAALEVLRADRAALGRLGRADAEREHDWARVFERIFDVYREVLAERRAR